MQVAADVTGAHSLPQVVLTLRSFGSWDTCRVDKLFALPKAKAFGCGPNAAICGLYFEKELSLSISLLLVRLMSRDSSKLRIRRRHYNAIHGDCEGQQGLRGGR